MELNLKVEILEGCMDGVLRYTWMPFAGQIYVAPKDRLNSLFNYLSLSPSGAYILVGENTNGKDEIYVGKSTELHNRLKNHKSHPPIKWNKVVAINYEKSDYILDTGASYLEADIVRKARAANKTVLANKKDPAYPAVATGYEDGLKQILKVVYQILPLVGFAYFGNDTAPIVPVDTMSTLFTFKKNDRIATGYLRADKKFVLLKGSKIFPKETANIGYSRAKNLRVECDKYFDHTNYLTTEDIIFESANSAAVFVAGYSIAGTAQWKTVDGKNPNDF